MNAIAKTLDGKPIEFEFDNKGLLTADMFPKDRGPPPGFTSQYVTLIKINGVVSYSQTSPDESNGADQVRADRDCETLRSMGIDPDTVIIDGVDRHDRPVN